MGMAKDVKITLQHNGVWKKFVGGKYFYFGHEEMIAKDLAAAVGNDWERICLALERGKRLLKKQEAGYTLNALERGLVAASHDEKPEWDEIALKQIEIRKRQAYGEHVEPMPTIDQMEQQRQATRWGENIEAERKRRGIVPDRAGGPTVGDACKIFVALVANSESRSFTWRQQLKFRIGKLKAHLGAKTRMADFGFDELTKAIADWIGQAKSGDISPASSDSYIRCLRQFVDWADASDKVEWEAPRRWDKIFKEQRKGLAVITGNKTPGGGTGNGDKAISITDLATFYSKATEPQRLYLLLGLNCGFTQVDISTLTPDMIHFGDKPYIERGRSKTGIYGKWFLWPETAAILETSILATARLKKTFKLKSDKALLSREGKELIWFDEASGNKIDSVVQCFQRLRQACKLYTPGYSFKYLRKTGSQMVRDLAGKEFSEAYLAHTDKTIGKHYNDFNQWDRLGDTLMEIRKRLQPMFDAAPKPDPEKRIKVYKRDPV